MPDVIVLHRLTSPRLRARHRQHATHVRAQVLHAWHDLVRQSPKKRLRFPCLVSAFPLAMDRFDYIWRFSPFPKLFPEKITHGDNLDVRMILKTESDAKLANAMTHKSYFDLSFGKGCPIFRKQIASTATFSKPGILVRSTESTARNCWLDVGLVHPIVFIPRAAAPSPRVRKKFLLVWDEISESNSRFIKFLVWSFFIVVGLLVLPLVTGVIKCLGLFRWMRRTYLHDYRARPHFHFHEYAKNISILADRLTDKALTLEKSWFGGVYPSHLMHA